MIIDGTNGLIQQYDYQTPTTGFSYTFAAGTTTLVMNPAGTLATGTITMPAAPADGMSITFSSSQQITALTLNGNTGQTVNGGVTFLAAKTAVSYVYRLASTSWWPISTVPGTGSQLVSGTANTSLSGTSIDFTGIPSWAKRITVMFNGVSTSGTSFPQFQLGSGSFTTSGYSGSSQNMFAANNLQINSLGSGFIITDATAADVRTGIQVFTLITGNTWIGVGSFSTNPTGGSNYNQGVIALPGTLDRVRITTVNGTDTFDAGSINILYE
jgi:hypothetical protein